METYLLYPLTYRKVASKKLSSIEKQIFFPLNAHFYAFRLQPFRWRFYLSSSHLLLCQGPPAGMSPYTSSYIPTASYHPQLHVN